MTVSSLAPTRWPRRQSECGIPRAYLQYKSTLTHLLFKTCSRKSTRRPTSFRPSRIVRVHVKSPSSYPSSQLPPVKSGYPPQSLTAIPELPLDSLGLKPGEQLIVNAKPGGPGPSSAAPIASAPPSQTASTPIIPPPPQAAPPATSGPDSVEIDGGALVHRVRASLCISMYMHTYHLSYIS